MDPQAPNVPTITPEAASTSQIPEHPKDNHGVTILAMAVFVLLSLGAVAFLYQQNQQLKGMLAGYYQTPTPFPTPSSTPDVTASWKTYTNLAGDVSFKYPNEFTINGDGNIDLTQKSTAVAMNVVSAPSGYVTFLVWAVKTNQTLSQYVEAGRNKNPLPLTQTTQIPSIQWIGKYQIPSVHYLSFAHDGYIINLGLVGVKDDTRYDPSDIQLLNQILSTFKFTSASPSAVPSTIPVSTSSALPVTY